MERTRYYGKMKSSRKKFVVIGGGTGTSMVLKGLKEYPVDLSVIVTTADDGGSSGRLRKELNMVPPGDCRQCLVALASSHNTIASWFHDRHQCEAFRGHAVGNLIIANVFKKVGDFQAAIAQTAKILDARGHVYPVTECPTTLCAYLSDGQKLVGEYAVISSREISKKLVRLNLEPSVSLSPYAREAVQNADVIIIGPGNFFSSIIPNLLVEGMPDALRNSKAKKIYIANLLTQSGHTDGFSLQDFIRILTYYIGADIFGYILYNSEPIDPEWYRIYTIEGEEVRPNPGPQADSRFIGTPLLSSEPFIQNPHDPLPRTAIRHNPITLSHALLTLIR